jgi:hypothetical protein
MTCFRTGVAGILAVGEQETTGFRLGESRRRPVAVDVDVHRAVSGFRQRVRVEPRETLLHRRLALFALRAPGELRAGLGGVAVREGAQIGGHGLADLLLV